jgi:hypothetical protein
VTSERDRYGRASLVEQLGDAVRAFWRNRTARMVAIAVLGALLVYRLITPEFATLGELRAGDCLFIRGPGLMMGLEEPSTARQRLQSEGAELAPCTGSHGHEVSAVIRLPEPPGTPYPGEAALIERHLDCEDVFEQYVGRPLAGSVHDTMAVVPNEAGWNRGERGAACLVFLRSGDFSGQPAQGSGR